MAGSTNKIAVCGMQTALAKAYARMLLEYDMQVVTIAESDFTRPAPDLAAKIDGCLAICNISRVPLVTKWTSRSQYDIFSSRMLSLRAFKKALSLCQNPPKSFICVSNAMLYDQYEVHDDFSTMFGDSFFSEVGQMETRCTIDIGHEHPGMRIIIVRMGFVLCKNSGPFPLMKKLSSIRLGGVIGSGYQCLPMIHVNDAARALFRFSTDVHCQGIYNLTIPEIASMIEFVGAFKKRQFTAPHFVIDFFAGRASAVLSQNCKVIPSRLTQEGFTFEFPKVEMIVNDLLGRKAR